MSEIAPVTEFDKIPKDTACQARSPMSGMRYIACGKPAVAIVASGGQSFFMCQDCTFHHLREHGAGVIFSTDAELKRRMKNGSVKIVKGPDARQSPGIGNSSVVEGKLPER